MAAYSLRTGTFRGGSLVPHEADLPVPCCNGSPHLFNQVIMLFGTKTRYKIHIYLMVFITRYVCDCGCIT